MGIPKTIAFLFLLICVVERNNGVPVPRTLAPSSQPQTELYTDTYTDISTDTVLSADTEGAMQESHGEPLEEDPVAEPNADQQRGDNVHTINSDDYDNDNENDAQGGEDDNRFESDTDIISEEGTLLTSKENETFVDGGNDTHGAPHDGVNNTAEGTESTQHVLSLMPNDTSSVVVSTDSMVETSSAALVGLNTAVVTPHRDLKMEEFSATPDRLDLIPGISQQSTRPPQLTSRTAAMLHHGTNLSADDESANDEITIEPLATEIYTEIMEVTDFVMSDTEESNSEETISEQHEGDRDIVNKAEDETNSTPIEFALAQQELDPTAEIAEPSVTSSHLTPSIAGILPLRTDSAPKEESVNDDIIPSLDSFVTDIYTEIMEITDYEISETDSKSEETISEQDEGDRAILNEAGDGTRFTPNEFPMTPQGLHLTPDIPEPSITLSNLTPSIAAMKHHRTESAPNDEITIEPLVTEIYTEIMDITDFVMSDTDSESDQVNPIQDDGDSVKMDIINTEDEDPSLRSPQNVVSSSSLDTNPTLPYSSVDQFEMADRIVLTPEDGDNVSDNNDTDTSYSTYRNSDVTSDNSYIFPDYIYISSQDSYITSDNIDISPDSSDILPDNSNISPDSSDYTLYGSDISSDNSDLTPDDSDITSEDSDSSSDITDIPPEDSDFTPDSSDSDIDTTGNFAENLVTEICTEIMEITELVLSDANDSQSDETLLIADNSDVTFGDSELTPDYSNVTPDKSEISSDNSDNSPDYSNISLYDSDITSSKSDISLGTTDSTPDERDILSDGRNITSNNTDISSDNSHISPDDSNISPNDSDITSTSSDISSDTTDATPDENNRSPNNTDITPSDQNTTHYHESEVPSEECDMLRQQLLHALFCLRCKILGGNAIGFNARVIVRVRYRNETRADVRHSIVIRGMDLPFSNCYTSRCRTPGTSDGHNFTSDGSEITPDNSEITPDNSNITPDNSDITPDNSNITPDNSDIIPQLSASFPQTTDSLQDSTSSTMKNMDVTSQGLAARTSMAPQYTVSSSDEMTAPITAAKSTPGMTPEQPVVSSRVASSTPKNLPTVPSPDIANASSTLSDRLIGIKITPSSESFVTEIYTEIVEMTEISLDEIDSKSDDTVLGPTSEDSVLVNNDSSDEIYSDSTQQGSTRSPTDRSQYTTDVPSPSTLRVIATPPDTNSTSDVITPQDNVLGDESAPSPDPIATEIYTEVIEVTEILTADTEVVPNDSEAKPDDTEVEPDDTEVEPDDTEVEPEDTRVEPVDSVAEPDDTESEPDDNEVEPDDTESESDDTEVKSDDIESEPDDTESESDDTEVKPDDIESEPDDTESEPIDTEANTPQVSDGESREIYTEVIEVTEILTADTEVVLDDTEAEPDSTEAEPDDTEAEPDDTESEPDDTEVVPDDTESEPDDIKSEPNDTEAEPDETEAEPVDTKAVPYDTEAEPDDTFLAPDNQESMQEDIISDNDHDTDNTPQVSDGESREIYTEVIEVTEILTADIRVVPDENEAESDDTEAEPADTEAEPNNTDVEPDGTEAKPYDTDNTPQISDGVSTGIYTEVIEVTETLTDSSEAKHNDTLLSPDNVDYEQGNIISNEELGTDYAPQDSSEDNQSSSTPNILTPTIPNPTLHQNSTTSSLKNLSTERNTTMHGPSTTSKAAVDDTNSPPDRQDTSSDDL